MRKIITTLAVGLIVLLGALTTAAPASANGTAADPLSVQQGDRGGQVKFVNNNLFCIGLVQRDVGNSGYFSARTAKAVRTFQKSIHIEVTGIATAKVQARLISACHGGVSVRSTSRRG